MAAAASNFEPWLIQKLKELKIDEGVYGSYITGILEGDESIDEKREALEGILSEIAVSWWNHFITIHVTHIIYFLRTVFTFCYVLQEKNVEAVVSDLLEKWESCQPKEELAKSNVDVVDAQLAKLMNTRCLATTARREYTDEEKKIREAILSQYSQLSDNEVGSNLMKKVEVISICLKIHYVLF